jgi:hypothetical protein
MKIILVAQSKEWPRHIAKIGFLRGKMKNRWAFGVMTRSPHSLALWQ